MSCGIDDDELENLSIDDGKIECLECHRRLRKINNTHLWNCSKMTMAEYKAKHPGQIMMHPDLHKMLTGAKFAGKTYEEIYGDEFAAELKQMRSESTAESWGGKYPWSDYRERGLEAYGLQCSRCGLETQDKQDFVVHHKDMKNIHTELGNHDISNLEVLCLPCHTKLHHEINKLKGKLYGLSHIERGTHYLFAGLKREYGLDLNDPNFKDTPKRVARAYAEIFHGLQNTKKQIAEIVSSSFPCDNDSLIVSKGIRCFGICPHHLLPVEYWIDVGYLPKKRVIGVSKLNRIVEVLSSRPVLQESLTMDIVKVFTDDIASNGAMCITTGRHLCMAMRGIKNIDAKVINSAVTGLFKTDLGLRSEFMFLTGRGNVYNS
jgi:GTP cyclohydrolase I